MHEGGNDKDHLVQVLLNVQASHEKLMSGLQARFSLVAVLIRSNLPKQNKRNEDSCVL